MEMYKTYLLGILRTFCPMMVLSWVVEKDNLYVYIAFFSVLLVYLTFILLRQLRYKMGKADYIRFPSINDEFNNTTEVIFGAGLLVGTGITLYIHGSLNMAFVLAFLVGALTITTGLMNEPMGYLRLKAKKLKIYGCIAKIDQNKLKSIKIYREKIVLELTHAEDKMINNLNIDQKAADLIGRYVNLNKENKNITVSVEIECPIAPVYTPTSS